MRGRISAPVLALAILCSGVSGPLFAQETHLLVVVGLGGDPAYRDLFHGWAVDLTSAAVTRLGLADSRVVYLGERPEAAPGVVDDQSTLENLASAIARMAGDAGPRDRILLILIGHGTGQGEEARFNLPGPDLTPEDLRVMLSDFPTQTVAVVITSSSSGPFIPILSGPNRVVLTATRSALERNETQFGGFFVEALLEDGSDLDKDGRTSLAEAFEYARREVERYYESRNLLATEHPQLDDDGDGEGSTELGGEVSDGHLARSFWLEAPPSLAVQGLALDSIADPELLRLYGEKAELERRVLELRALRGQMEESRYEQELEALLVELALKNREIRDKGGGSW
jgi:hypothetical protein